MTQVHTIEGNNTLMMLSAKINEWCAENSDNIKQPPKIQIMPTEYMNFFDSFKISKYSAIIIYEV